jgi:acetylcholinesterase
VGYKNVQQRLALLISETFIGCNAHYLAHALKDHSHGYIFGVPPGFHGQDIAYTFFTDSNPNVRTEFLASSLQQYLMRFVRTENPNGGDLPDSPVYGNGSLILDLGNNGFKVGRAEVANRRCNWLQDAF